MKASIHIILLIILALPVVSYSQDSTRADTTDKSSSAHPAGGSNVLQSAHPSKSWRLGLYGGYQKVAHTTSFTQLPNVPNCCEGFTEGNGDGFVLGAVYQMPLSFLNDMFSLQARLGYSSVPGTMRTQEFIGFALVGNGNVVPAISEHTIMASPGILGLEPAVSFTPFESFPLSLNLGLSAGLLITKPFEQNERLIGPSNSIFVDGEGVDNQTRNSQQGDIENSNLLQSNAIIGLSYDFIAPVSIGDQSLIISPEVSYTHGLTSILKDEEWKVNTWRFGIAIMLAFPVGDSGSGLIPDSGASLYAVGLDERGNEMPDVAINVEEFSSTRMHPLLNSVFFDEGSATLPLRYKRLANSAEAQLFREDEVSTQEAIPVYYDLLNVIGKRMQDNPAATLTLKGYNSGVNSEADNIALSKDRAQTVASYLKNIWGVSASRMRVEGANLPLQPSPVSDPQGAAENRRVEIMSDSPDILKPVTVQGVERRVNPPSVRFYPKAPAKGGIASWQIDAYQAGKLLYTKSGGTSMPSTSDWHFREVEVPGTADKLEYQLTTVDETGKTNRTPLGSVNVVQKTVAMKSREQQSDTAIGRYRLLFFAFGKGDLKEMTDRSLDAIKKSISPNSIVAIKGHTDIIGDDEVNRRLSIERAEQVAAALGVDNSSASGVGESGNLYDQSTPEGRFYSRTVDVEVKSPVTP